MDLHTVEVGVRSMVAPLRRALVRRPVLDGDFAGAGWRPPEPRLLRHQHETFCELLSGLGVDVIVAPAVPGLVDATYMYDSAFVIGGGAVILRSAKPARAGEDEAAAAALRAAGVPINGRLTDAARADGGDLFWLDHDTLVAGRGYRTNAEAHRQLAAYTNAVGACLERVDLVHDRGPAHVLHTMSVISPVTDSLAVVFEPLLPVPLVELLAARGIDTIPVHPDEYATLGANVLAVQPGVVVVVDGNPRIRRALLDRGLDVYAYDGSEVSLKGDGGPTCLTRPVWRA